MLRYKTFYCTRADSWCNVIRRYKIFSPTSIDAWCYVTRSSLVLAQTLDATLQDATCWARPGGPYHWEGGSWPPAGTIAIIAINPSEIAVMNQLSYLQWGPSLYTVASDDWDWLRHGAVQNERRHAGRCRCSTWSNGNGFFQLCIAQHVSSAEFVEQENSETNLQNYLEFH